ncbi:MAG: hypothetical protein AMXMBFR82_23460 [Candidatus Hydrogenedentota bacterium]
MELQEAEEIRADKKRAQDIIDQQLRIASMALDAGDPVLARETLVDATGWMAANNATPEDFDERADRATRMIGGEERDKYFLGDPYEQFAAYFLLGVLDFQAGDYENAASSFRSASLSDTLSRQPGYQSDSYLAFLLEGVSQRMAGNSAAAEEAFRLAANAHGFRQRMPLVAQAMYLGGYHYLEARKAEGGDEKETDARFDVVFPLVFNHLPLATALGKDDLATVIQQAADSASGALDAEEFEKDSIEESVAKEYKKELPAAKADIQAICDQAVTALTPEMLAALDAAETYFSKLVDECRNPLTNTFVIQQTGNAPYKIRMGAYGEALQFRSVPNPVDRALIALRPSDGAASQGERVLLAANGDSLDYQARTRGGREMDHILKGKAQFKDAMSVSNNLAAWGGTVATTIALAQAMTVVTTVTTTTTYTVSSTGAVTATTTTTTSSGMAGFGAAGTALGVAAAMYGIYVVTMVIMDSLHPEGDVRGWHELPDRYYFACDSLAPGSYEIESNYFDKLGQPLDEKTERYRFTVDGERPALLYLGTPWS